MGDKLLGCGTMSLCLFVRMSGLEQPSWPTLQEGTRLELSPSLAQCPSQVSEDSAAECPSSGERPWYAGKNSPSDICL